MPPFYKNSSYGPLTALLACVTRPIFHFCPPSFLVLMPSVAVKYVYRTATFATLRSVLIFLTWFSSSGLEDVTAAVTAIYLSRFCIWPEVQTTVCVLLWPSLLCGGLMCSSETTFQFIFSPGRRPWTIGFKRPARSSTVCWPESQAGGTAACCYTLVDRDAKTWAWRSLGGGDCANTHTRTQTCTHTHNVVFKMQK